MALKTIMLLLTLSGDGTAHVNFSEAETMEACTAKIAAVKKVLKAAEIEIIDLRCAESGLAVSKYQRGAPADAPRYPFKVTLTKTGFDAVPVVGGDCRPSETEDRTVVCATSTQRSLDDASGQ